MLFELDEKQMSSETAQGQDYFKLKEEIVQRKEEIRKLAEAVDRFQKDINLRLKKLEIDYDAQHKA